MSDDEIEAFADLIYDSAIKYANGYETDFRPIARKIAQASRRAALEECQAALMEEMKEDGAIEWKWAANVVRRIANGDVK